MSRSQSAAYVFTAEPTVTPKAGHDGQTAKEREAHREWLAWCDGRHAAEMGNGNGTVRISVCGRAVEHYAAMARMKRSPKITANWALAIDHSRGGIFHSFSDRFKIR